MGVGDMSDNKILLFVFGLAIGFGTFAAIGGATSIVMTEVQERVAPQAQLSPTSFAQVRSDRDAQMR